jgi:hypothetical protein
MFDDKPLQLELPVCQTLLANESALQTLLGRFFNWRMAERDELFGPLPRAQARKIALLATPRAASPPAPGVGCFFSGGLDSFYTALSLDEEITHLIYVLGYDVPLHQEALGREVVHRLAEVARALGKKLVVISTDLRRYSDDLVHWHMYHGPALIAAGLLLSSEVGRIYVPSTYTYEYLTPSGTHPLLDGLWSTGEIEFRHHGCGADRAEKAALVGRCDVALEHLRVCWENPGGRYNCGECEKCQRTRVEFEVSGHGGALRSVPGRTSLADLRAMPVDPRTVKFWKACLAMAERQGSDPLLIAALRQRLKASPSKRLRRAIHETLLTLRRGLKRLRRDP